MAEKTRYEKFEKWYKNNRIIIFLVVVVTIYLTASKVIKATKENYDIFKPEKSKDEIIDNSPKNESLKEEDQEAKGLDIEKFDWVDEQQEGLSRIVISDKFGFINQKNELVIPPVYDFANRFYNGFSLAMKNGKWGYLDKDGIAITAFKYKEGRNFSEGRAAVAQNMAPTNIEDYDRSGDEFSISIGSGYDWGFIDENGNEITPIKYRFDASFNNGIAVIDYCCGEFYDAIINKNGTEIISKFFTPNHPVFSEEYGTIMSYDDEEWKLINKWGETVLNCEEYLSLGRVSEGIFYARNENEKYGFLDLTGRVIIPFIYDDAGDFSNNLAPVLKNDKWGFIDRNNNEIIPFTFEKCRSFKAGLAECQKNDYWGVINTSGGVIVEFEYEYGDISEEGYVVVHRKGKSGLLNREGDVIIPLKYERVEFPHCGLSLVSLNKEYGFLDLEGQVKIPLKYKSCLSFKDNLSRVKTQDGESFMINRNGERVCPEYDESVHGTPLPWE